MVNLVNSLCILYHNYEKASTKSITIGNYEASVGNTNGLGRLRIADDSLYWENTQRNTDGSDVPFTR